VESPNATPARVPQFLTIVEDDDIFPFVWEEFDGTTFDLRIVSDDRHKTIRRQHTKTKFNQGQRHEITDWTAVTEACLEYAIANVRGLKARGKSGEPVDLDFAKLEHARQNQIKALLPERCKAEIIRLCVGKEAGDAAEKKS
jgi:hypothetical protein